MSNEAGSTADNRSEVSVRPRPRYGRALDIALSTAHIGKMGVLCGGHVFDAPPEKLQICLFWVILTGGLLTVVEAFPRVCWLY